MIINVNKMFHGYPKKMLTREEEQEIALLPPEHPDRGKLVTHNYRFLVQFALKASRKNKNLWDIEETIGILQVEMLEASRTFSPCGVRFISYAIRKMRWGLRKCWENQLPVKMRCYDKKFFVDLNKVGCFYAGEVKEDDAVTFDETVSSLETESLRKYLARHIRNLPKKRDREVMVSYYFHGKTLAEIGKDYGVSYKMIGVIKDRSLAKLLQMVSEDGEL